MKNKEANKCACEPKDIGMNCIVRKLENNNIFNPSIFFSCPRAIAMLINVFITYKSNTIILLDPFMPIIKMCAFHFKYFLKD